MSKLNVLRLLFRRKKHRNSSDLHFPLEIWALIITCLSDRPGTLFSLLTICSALCHDVERVLYCNIDLSGDCEAHFSRRMRLFNRLAGQPRIAQLVDSFTIPPLITEKTYYRAIIEEYGIAVNRALQAMSHLRSLTIGQFSSIQWWLGSGEHHLVANCKFRLRQLSLGSYLGANVKQIIEEHHYLVEDLTLQDSEWFELPTGAFPNLQILDAKVGRNRIPQMLQEGNRSIRAVRFTIVGYNFDRGPFINVMALRLDQGIRRGSLEATQICETFPSLRYLRLDCRRSIVRTPLPLDCRDLKPLTG